MIVAIVAAALAGILTIRYLSGIQHAPDAPVVVAQRYVIIASRTIYAHEKIVPDMLTKVSRPETAVEPGALAEPREAVGSIALASIPDGSTLTRSKIGVPAALGVTAKLENGMRALSIPVDYIKSVSSLVEPGDRVDVLATSTRGRGGQTRTVIRGALVLAVNSALAASDPSAPAPAQANAGPVSVTLAVTPAQANLLTYADITTTLRLALRPPKEPIRAFPVQSIDVGDQAADPAPPQSRPAESHANVPAPANPVAVPQSSVPAPSVPAAPPAVRDAPPHGTILVIEGDSIVAGQR